MNTKKTLPVILLTAICILINFGGRYIAVTLNLPLWLDSFGTALMAYAMGPVCGAIVGLASNIIYGITVDIHAFAYGTTNIAIGFIIGISARRGRFEYLFGTMSVSVLLTLVSVAVSVPLNQLFLGGMTGNLWGNGVIGYLREHNIPNFATNVIGQFYIDFLDKVLTLMALFLLIRLIRRIRKRKSSAKPAKSAAAAIAVALLMLPAAEPQRASAAQNTNQFSSYVQTIYNRNSGLPCGEANDIVQTNDGVLWIGTYAGLYRYDGNEFRQMDQYESVRNVNVLYVDEEGRLWIGTNDNGLTICINERVSNVVGTAEGLPSDSVRCITKATDGLYYIGTTDAMQVMTLNSGLQSVCQIPEVHYADCISADQNGNAAAVTSDGSLCLLREGKLLAQKTADNGDDPFTCCAFSAEGILYAGTSGNKLLSFDITEGSFTRKSSRICNGIQHLNEIYFADDGMTFLCADNGVGYLDAADQFGLLNTNEFNNSIDRMEIDYQGNLWFASSRLGLMRFSESMFTDIYRQIGMEQAVVNTVQEWQGNLYIGTDNGLDIINAECTKQINNAITEQFAGVRIRCIRADSRDHLWLCTYGSGLVELSPDGKQTVYNSESGSFGNRARVVMELSDGTVAAAGDTGISFIREQKITQSVSYGNGLSNALILSLLETEDGKLLAGTDGDGIAVINPENGEVTNIITREEGLSSGVILRMLQSSARNTVYIITSNGLCVMDQNGDVRTLNSFPYFNNYDIWEDGSGKLFVLGSAGIYIAEEEAVYADQPDLHYELLDSQRGMRASLTANAWNYRDANGCLYLSCDNGIYRLDMNSYSAGRRSYRLSVSEILLDGEPVEPENGTAFEIDRNITKIEIFPEILNYSVEDPNVQYQLDGFDAAPTVLAQSALDSITYTNLLPGTYTFRLAILDANSGGILEERAYQLTVNKEMYDNVWFRLYMSCVAMLAVAWFTWYLARTRVQRTLEKQQHQLELAENQLKMGNETIIAIAKTVDAKDGNTSQHSQRVSEYAVMLAQELGFSPAECENLRKAALLHDIGKIGIPDRILNKPAKLTDEEYAVMKTHVTRGAEILKDFTLIDHVVDGAKYHHERYDGRGYPSGLKGEEIPIYGRIIGVADAFDAMTANRVYRKKLDLDFVLGELERCSGTQFDPQIAKIMLDLVHSGKVDVQRIYDACAAENAEQEQKTPDTAKTEENQPETKDDTKS